MKIDFMALFVQVGITFDFSHKMYKYLRQELSSLILPSDKFIKFYKEEDYTFIFCVSAKKELSVNEIVGPLTSRKNKTLEFSIFLPHTLIMLTSSPMKNALEHLFQGICEVLEKYDIDTSKIRKEQGRIIEYIMSSPEMFI